MGADNKIDILITGRDSSQPAFRSATEAAESMGRKVADVDAKMTQGVGGGHYDPYVQGAKQAEDATTTLTERLGEARDSFEELRNAGVKMALIGEGLVLLADKAGDVAMESDNAQAKLAAMMAKQGEGGLVAEMDEALEKVGALAHVPAIAPLKDSAANLKSFGMSADQISGIMDGLIGQSRVMKQDLFETGNAVGRAFGKGDVTGLTRIGITLTDEQKARIEALKAAGVDQATRQAAMYAILKESFAKYALSMNEGLSESQIKANDFARTLEATNERTGAGVNQVRGWWQDLGASILESANGNPGLEKTAGAVGYLGAQTLTTVGGIAAFVGEMGIAALTVEKYLIPLWAKITGQKAATQADLEGAVAANVKAAADTTAAGASVDAAEATVYNSEAQGMLALTAGDAAVAQGAAGVAAEEGGIAAAAAAEGWGALATGEQIAAAMGLETLAGQQALVAGNAEIAASADAAAASESALGAAGIAGGLGIVGGVAAAGIAIGLLQEAILFQAGQAIGLFNKEESAVDRLKGSWYGLTDAILGTKNVLGEQAEQNRKDVDAANDALKTRILREREAGKITKEQADEQIRAGEQHNAGALATEDRRQADLARKAGDSAGAAMWDSFANKASEEADRKEGVKMPADNGAVGQLQAMAGGGIPSIPTTGAMAGVTMLPNAATGTGAAIGATSMVDTRNLPSQGLVNQLQAALRQPMGKAAHTQLERQLKDAQAALTAEKDAANQNNASMSLQAKVAAKEEENRGSVARARVEGARKSQQSAEDAQIDALLERIQQQEEDHLLTSKDAQKWTKQIHKAAQLRREAENAAARMEEARQQANAILAKSRVQAIAAKSAEERDAILKIGQSDSLAIMEKAQVENAAAIAAGRGVTIPTGPAGPAPKAPHVKTAVELQYEHAGLTAIGQMPAFPGTINRSYSGAAASAAAQREYAQVGRVAAPRPRLAAISVSSKDVMSQATSDGFELTLKIPVSWEKTGAKAFVQGIVDSKQQRDLQGWQ